jgi:hydrogenase expression/formation protein HypE
MNNGSIVMLAHGSGGRQSHELVESLFLRYLGRHEPALEDAAYITPYSKRLVFTTDSFVVKPLIFPGGDIGRLAVCGTVNDLAMRGAQPLCLSAGFILEEGLTLELLEQILASMQTALHEAGTRIITGDTKVVEHGSADGLFINTAGIGIVPEGVSISAANARAGDVVLLSGAVGDHGLAVMTQRQRLHFSGSLRSDCAPLNGLVAAMLAAAPDIHVLRDATRGGLAAVLNEIASASGAGIEIDEPSVPVHEAVRAASEILGLDFMYAANEGKLAAIVPAENADAVLTAMRIHPLGAEAAIIGRVIAEHPGKVALRTILGTRRLLDMPAGEQLPRIC